MKRNIILVLMVLVLGIVTLHSQDVSDDSKETGNLTVVVIGFESDKGQLRIALFNSEETYSNKKEPKEPFIKALASIKDKKAIWVFEDIPFGEYTVICYHDENGNEKMDRNFLGIPKEKYGFSNNAKGKLGPPDYEDAKFIFNAEIKNIEIRI